MNVLMLAAGGQDSYQQAGAVYPKNLAEIAGRPLIQHVLDWLAPLKRMGARFICAIDAEENRRFYTGSVIELLAPGAIVLEAPEATGGAACTALLGVELIDNDDPLVIVNGDIVMDVDPAVPVEQFQSSGLDAGAVIFQAVHPRWSYVRLNDDRLVIEAAEKRPISTYATAGMYWYSRGSDFVRGAASMLQKSAAVDGRFYVAPVFNEMVLKGCKIGTFEITPSQYHSLKEQSDARAWEQSLASDHRRAQ